MRIIISVFFLLYQMMFVVKCGYSQTMHLVNKHKRINFCGGIIGLTTKQDTIPYELHNVIKAYHIAGFDEQSITIRRPGIYYDTLVLQGEYQSLPYLPYNYENYRITGRVKKDDRKYYSLILISEFEFKTYQFKDITSVQYPPEADETTGCIFCPFMPVYNIFFFKKMSRRWKPETFDLRKWSFMIEANSTKKENAAH